MQSRVNRRGHEEHYTAGHLKLNDLKVSWRFSNQYLSKENIPDYPRPEFHVSSLKHDTDRGGLRGIKRDSGFKNPYVYGGYKIPLDENSLMWWSLAVGPEEIAAAETRLLKTTYPDRTEEEVKMQQSFLEKFATSPAFLQTSRFGSYRFTFPVEELLTAYSDQFCDGRPPVMRALETKLYKQEVVHTVLVHSPAQEELYSSLPLLPDAPDAVCSYKGGRFIWRSEAMCETHSFELVKKDAEKRMEAVLQFDDDQLGNNLTVCEPPQKGPTLIPREEFEKPQDAEDLVQQLWPDSKKFKEELDEIKKDE
ncbi:uncharacterized protein V6R79_026406 [Siganus canaliculatus]